MPNAKVPSSRSATSTASGAKAPKSEKVSARKPAAAKAKMPAASAKKTSPPKAPKARKPASLPKSDGDAGVQAYIASLEPWQADIAGQVDALIAKHVPGVRKAVKWHCPFYGVEGQGWFLSFAAFQYHIKFTFFKGTSLKPVPPVGEHKDARSLDVREADKFDEKRFAAWIKQAAAIPGWNGGSKSAGGSAI